jgi:hypothetical protein
MELSGPIVPGWLRYRAFAGGGAGLDGDFGGRELGAVQLNPIYSVGGQFMFTPIGLISRFDSPFLYRTVPLALGIGLGGKWEQREQERFPAVHGLAIFRWGILQTQFESYTKAEINFGAVQAANYAQVGVLVWPEWVFLAADIGHFTTSDFGLVDELTGFKTNAPPANLTGSLRTARNEWQTRAAAHFYFWRANGVATVRYAYGFADPLRGGPQSLRGEGINIHEVLGQIQLRF